MINADRGVLKLALFCALLGVLIPIATGQVSGCSSKFPRGGLISSCKHADGRPYNVKELKSPQYGDGSRCLFRCTGGAPVERDCQDGQWSGYEIECLTGDVNIKTHTTSISHHRPKRFWGVALAIGGGLLAGAAIGVIGCALKWWCKETTQVRVIEAPTDTYPPSLSCPENIQKTAERGKNSVRIDKPTWGHPIKAEDKNAEQKIVHPEALLTGLPASSRFERGETTLTYSYTDGGGNSARCEFTVTVTVPECPEIPYDQYGTFDCSGAEESYIHGSTCTLYCITGYQASSPATVTCEGNGAWSGDIPDCSIKSCSTTPSDPEHGSHACSRDQEYNSVCTFSCDEGYTISGAHSQLCTTDGNSMIWVPNEAPICQDTQGPQLTCPTGIETIRAAEGETTALVTWEEPTATDNSGEHITPVQTTEIEKDKHPAGYYDIRYEATDSSGQSAECIFGFRVEVVSCSLNQLYLPLGTFDCDDNQFIWGSTCSFQCSLGHRLTGQNDTVCEDTGLWQGDVPSCNALTCPDYSVPVNGEVINGCTDATFGQFCQISCDPGYDLRGTSTARCIASGEGVEEGNWDHENSTCVAKTCTAMYSPNHGSINDECDGKKVPFGTECHFSCDEGYWLTGPDTNNCTVEGRWNNPMPFCRAKTCHSSELPIPTNGVKSGCPNEEEYYGTTCVLSCLTGYLPKEQAQVICQNSENPTYGQWSNNSFASCEIVKCPASEKPGNGSIERCQYGGEETDLTTDQKYSTVCSMACDDGFTVTGGTLRRTCTEMATWDGSELQCEDITSPLLYCPADQLYFTEQRRISYDPDWSWEPVEATDRGLTFFAILTKINAQVVTEKAQTLSEGVYVLEYEAVDRAGLVSTCTFKVTVQVTRCPVLLPPSPPFGHLDLVLGKVSCSSAVYGSQCRQSCISGYHLTDTDDALLNCTRNSDSTTIGIWKGTVGNCQPNQCTIPDVPNGYVSGCPANVTDYNSICQFQCISGYKSPSGQVSVNSRCKADKSWTVASFECEAVFCSASFSLTNGQVTPSECGNSTSLPYGTLCRFSCDNGFMLQGPTFKQCLSDGTWSDVRNTSCTDHEPPQFTVPCPQYIDAAARSGTTTAEVSYTEPIATDNSGNVTVLKKPGSLGPGSIFPEGTTRIPYIAIDATGLARQCIVYILVNVHRCQRLPAPLWGSYDSCPVDSPLGSSCSFRCNEGYVLNGPSTHTCEVDEGLGTGFWSGNETTCEAITCPAVQTNAAVIKSGCFSEPPQTERYGTTCQFYCPYGYGGVGDSKARCLANSSWSGDPEEFSCEERTCSPLRASTEYRTVPATCTSNPSYLDTCIHTCRKSGYRLQPTGLEFTTCLGNGQWTRDTSNLTCIDIEPPRFIYCPRDINVYADRGDTGALVNWTLPVAEDNSGETPTLIWNICPCVLPVGEHDVVYVATDDAGNQQTCEFTVKVDVRRCQQLQPPVHAFFTSRTCDNSYGTTCQVACSTGYQLSGSSNATCEFDGTMMYWERESQPYCSIATCSGLTPPENGDLYPSFCTTMPTYGTTCQYFCRNGYFLHPDVGALTCTSSGTWNGDTTTPECRDITSPHLLSCPGPQSGVLEGTNPTVAISWEVPTAVDNAPGQLRVVTIPAGIEPPYNFSQDTEVIYTFYDAANNSVQCRFQIYIQDELVPVVRSCPDDIALTTTTASTLVSWDPPVFEELTNDALIIVPDPAVVSSSTFTIGEHFFSYTATNPDNGKSAICSFGVTLTVVQCTDLSPPQNGALSCGDWGDRKTCTLLCNDAFDIPRGQSAERLYLCRNDGIWIPHDNVPDCTDGRNPRVNQLPSELQYYSGDCTDQRTKDSIAAAFVQLVTQEGFCSLSQGCSVDGVEVICGPISATGKRRRRRSTHTHVITIKFNFQVDLSIPPDGVLAEDDWLTSEEKLIEIANNFSTILGSHGQSLNVSGLQTEVDTTSYWHDDWSHLACDYGYTPDYNSLKCVGCGTGRYYDGDQDDCVSCPVGTYQNQFGQTSCIPCPEGFTSIREEARNITKCLPMCPLGQYSTTGVEPCSPCPKDTYQPMNGSTQCIPCPNGTRTVSVGATSFDSCHEPCAAGSFSLTGVQPCQPCTEGRYQPSTGKTACLPCEPHLTTVTVGSINSDECEDPCRNVICDNGGTCTFTSGNTSCSCLTGFEGERCENNIDDCSSQPCLNNATCVDGVNNYNCSCADGYTGVECAIDIDECESSPCQNNGTCEDRINGYTCNCFVGYEGPHCEEESDWCVDNPCRNGTCISSAEISNFTCLCDDGFRGDICDIDVDECLSQPCLNHGTCIDVVNGYQCRCHPGYTGSECQTDMDLCEDNPCHNNGTCVDLGLEFKCVCAENRGGELCEDVTNPCTGQPCQNGGTCTFSEDGSYSCTCGPGYAGFHCEDNIDECASQPCSNGGTCHDGHNGFSCECPDGLAGITCVDVVDRCAQSSCVNNGTCTVQQNGTIKCVCPTGYGGETCDQLLSSCIDNQCTHGATCQEEDSSYSCVCPQGYTGFFCDSPIDNCASEPCFNNAVCESTNSSYTCTCPDGLEGVQCTNDTDECSTFPCLYNGTCINSFGSYECICDDGYAGETCGVDVDECLSMPCLNGGTCMDSANGFSCECVPGYGGEICGEEADECLSGPCLHGAICTDMFNGFTCHCTPGWEGDTCEINKDDCATSPCQHNATCVDLVNDYRCECPVAYRGKNCSARTVSCSSHPCNNSGTCEEREDGGIHCTCTQGWTGTYCQINQDDCTPNPCRNGGNCKDLLNGYRCECTAAFTGSDCEEEVDECLGHDCRNGARCEDRLGHYICRCTNGYEGARCEQETNECDPNPCQNGATCTDEMAAFHCTCSTGFQGELCNENIDDCEASSCENGGVCIDGIASFSCLCKDGYSGFNCSVDVDECASSPCGDNAVCHDGIGTYTCTCKPGYTGRDCETELSPDYDLHFPGSSTADYSILPYGIQESLKVLRMGAWIRSSKTRGTVISHAVQRGDNFEEAFSISNPGNIVVTIGGESVTTGVRVDDSEWHHIAVKWLNRGTLTVYKDGNVVVSRREVHKGYVIPAGGYIVLGQMQTQLGGGFLVEDAFAGEISQLYIWKQSLSSAERTGMASSCGYVPAESIRAWPDFRWSIHGQVAERVPSRCDDFNECDSNPCASGSTCVNLPGSYGCRCPPGFTGQRCDEPIDFCVVSLCQNGATCHSGQTNYTCQCDEGYYGTFCEEKLGDGRWSPWLEWGPCTQTCGGGMHTRQRLCNNPPPAEGGKPCEGPSNQEQPCNTEKCPECIELISSDTTVLTCSTINATTTCTAACQPGYGFTEHTLERYTCGPETAYLWPHQSTDNLDGKLPECTAVTVPSTMVVDSYNGYRGLTCQSQEHKETIEKQLSASVESAVQQLSCQKTDDCNLKEVEAINCESDQSLRRKRQEDDEDIVFVRISFEASMAVENNEGNMANVNETALYIEQLNKMEEVITATGDWINSDVLTVEVDGQIHSPSEALLQYNLRYLCEEGSVPSTRMCAKCPPGSFWLQHACLKCPVGSYQGVEGMTDCEECPSGTTTEEEGALDITSCFSYSTLAPNVTTTRPSGLQGANTTLVAALTSSFIAAVALGIAIFSVILWRHRRKAKIGNLGSSKEEERTCPTSDNVHTASAGVDGMVLPAEVHAHLKLRDISVENAYEMPKRGKVILPPINYKTSKI